MISRTALERHQVWLYLLATAVGLAVGTRWPQLGPAADLVVWPVLALLLYATFTQIPLASLPAAFTNGRFLAAALIGNFVLIPAAVWGVVQLVPDDPALRLGLLLVLLVPCTDWFITFSQLGRADARMATALTPLLLVLQLMMLPFYLWLMADTNLGSVFAIADLWPALLVVALPLAAAFATERWAADQPRRERLIHRLGWWPVPLLAVVIGVIAAAHVGDVLGALHVLPYVAAAVLVLLAFSLTAAKALSRLLSLETTQGRTLAFSMGTRNSFIVLPFALSLPAGWEIAAVVIVLQSLVELLVMVFCLWFVPRALFPEREHRG